MRPSSIFLAAAVGLSATTVAIAPALAQESSRSVGLEEALALFRRNSPELQLARSRLRRDLGAERQGRAVSNPTASFTTEAVGEYSEQYLNVTQRVDFLWDAGGRNRRAQSLELAAKARFQADSARLASEVKRAYLEAWTGAEEVLALRRVDEVVDDLVDVAAKRFAEGDLAGYDLRRLRVERASVGRLLAQAEVTLAYSQERLAALVSGGDGMAQLQPRPLPDAAPAPSVSFDAVTLAVARRPEIRAAQANADAREAEAGLARRSFLAGASVTGGLKVQSDGREGLFLGFQVPVPILDRRSGAVDAARAAVQGADAEVEWVKRAVMQEASIALSRLQSAHRQRALLGDAGLEDAAELLRIARVAYDEGEVGIVEMVDAADTFLEAQLMDSAVRAEGWLAYFELDQAVGGFPDEIETGDER